MNEEAKPGVPTDLADSAKGGTGRLERNNLLLVVLGTAAFGFSGDFRQVLSFLAGGILTVANLGMFRIIVAGLVGERKTKKNRLIAQVVVKFLGLMGAVAFLMLVVKPAPLAFLLGLSTLVVAIMLEGVLGLFRSE